MRRRTLDMAVGLGLLLGPLGYALTLEPEVIMVNEIVEVAPPAAPTMEATEVIPTVAPVPAPPEPAPVEVTAEPEPVPTEGLLSFAFVNEAGLVLSTEAQGAWGKGRLRAHSGPAEFRAAKRASAAKVPEALWAQRGRMFDLYGANGKVCTARLGDLHVLAQHNGPDVYDLFHGDGAGYEDYDEFTAQKHTAKEIRRQVWSREAGNEYGSVWLVADVVSDQSCEGALWARDRALPAPELLTRSDETSPLTEARIAQHEASSELAELKTEYTEWLDQMEPEYKDSYDAWDTIAASHPAKVRTWHDAAGTPKFTELSFGTPTAEICSADVDAQLFAFDRVVDGGFESAPHAVDPLVIIDSDLDGEYELLYRDDENGWVNHLAGPTRDEDQMWFIDEEFYCPC